MRELISENQKKLQIAIDENFRIKARIEIDKTILENRKSTLKTIESTIESVDEEIKKEYEAEINEQTNKIKEFAKRISSNTKSLETQVPDAKSKLAKSLKLQQEIEKQLKPIIDSAASTKASGDDASTTASVDGSLSAEAKRLFDSGDVAGALKAILNAPGQMGRMEALLGFVKDLDAEGNSGALALIDKELLIEVKGKNYSLKEAVRDPEYPSGMSLVIGIFMTFYDVHVNRIPYPGVSLVIES